MLVGLKLLANVHSIVKSSRRLPKLPHSDLMHLSTVHVVVIDLVSSNRTVVALLLILYNHLVVHVMSIGEFVDHELLHLYNINDIHLSFDGIEN